MPKTTAKKSESKPPVYLVGDMVYESLEAVARDYETGTKVKIAQIVGEKTLSLTCSLE